MSDPAGWGPGLFVSLDGPDGAGKSTQAARLVEWLRARGHDVVSCRDPGGTPLGAEVRKLLLDRRELPLGTRAEMLLYMASRAQLIEQVIRPALDAGQIVVSDRYLLANVVYQGYAGGLSVDDLWSVGRVATGGLMPDLTILLDIPIEVARARIGEGRDRIEDRPDAYRQAVREGFRAAAATWPGRVVLLDGRGDAETIAGQIQGEVTHVLDERPRP